MVNPYNGLYYSAIKKNEILIYASNWMALQGIILSKKKANPKKFTYCMIPFI